MHYNYIVTHYLFYRILENLQKSEKGRILTTEVQTKYQKHCQRKGLIPLGSRGLGKAIHKVFPDIKHKTIYIKVQISKAYWNTEFVTELRKIEKEEIGNIANCFVFVKLLPPSYIDHYVLITAEKIHRQPIMKEIRIESDRFILAALPKTR